MLIYNSKLRYFKYNVIVVKLLPQWRINWNTSCLKIEWSYLREEIDWKARRVHLNMSDYWQTNVTWRPGSDQSSSRIKTSSSHRHISTLIIIAHVKRMGCVTAGTILIEITSRNSEIRIDSCLVSTRCSLPCHRESDQRPRLS